MNVFQTAKQINPADVARRLGLKESHGRFLCPFHDDHHPSLACYGDSRRFYCFSCHAKGDATDLWARVTGHTPKASAEEVCREFALQGRKEPGQTASPVQEKRTAQAAKQRVDAVAMLPQGVWEDWQQCMLTLLEEEFSACMRLMERYPDPEGWVWEFALNRAVRLQDEQNRLSALEPRLLAAEVAERRAAGEAASIPDQPVMDDALLQHILADRLRHADMRLAAEEQDYVCRTLGIVSPTEGVGC